MKKWDVQNNIQYPISNIQYPIDTLIDLLLENRGIVTAKEREEFLHPTLENVTPKSVGIDAKQLKIALTRMKRAIDEKEQIVVFGDYDVDGITGAAILWETLHSLGANALPYIPHRIDEGYGLSVKALENDELRTKNPSLIITVDNGIVANEAVEFANKLGIDVIVTDHHTASEKLPDALAIVHTTKLCGAGVAWALAQELKTKNLEQSTDKFKVQSLKFKVDDDSHLELAALGTVADLVPLVGGNRAIVKEGLKMLPRTKRPGLLALYKQASLEKEVFSTYEIGFIIGPRINAAGRVETGMDSLRLLCTKSADRAEVLAEKLELTNKERQHLMKASTEHAASQLRTKNLELKKLLFIADESYPQGVIGLVAGKLVQEFYRPAIVLSVGEVHSKASVRSVSGFNIVEFLRNASEHFVNVGGHPMAAGFTVETAKINILQERLEQLAEVTITEDVLQRSLHVDCELPLSAIDQQLYEAIQQLAPFGMGNPEPTFVSRGVIVKDIRAIGKEMNHLKLQLHQQTSHLSPLTSHLFDAIAFGFGELASQIKKGDAIDVAYTIDENTWNGTTKLQLKVKDIQMQ